jgi:adenine phosphoribosyltransferase
MPDATGLQLTDCIRSVRDFPKPGILFRDVTPLLASPTVFRWAVRQMADHFRDRGVNVVAAAEARGFLFAGPLALELDAALVPIRKPGKLPFKTMAYSYELEYGTDTLEMHVDAIRPGATVLVVDDLLATGGTAEACCQMIEKAGGRVVGCAFVIELLDCAGAKKLGKYETFSLVKYE